MSKSYDLYRDCHNIAHAIVRQSKGLGFSTFDVKKLHADIGVAAGIAKIAEEYWGAMHRKAAANERLNAAKLLGVDNFKQYTRELEKADLEEKCCIDALRAVVDSGLYFKDYYGNWRIKND